MSYTRWNNAEGQADTTTASIANTGGSATGGSGWAFDSNYSTWPTFSATTAASGTKSYNYAYSASKGTIIWVYSKPGITGDSIWVRFAFNTSDNTITGSLFNASAGTNTFSFNVTST